MRANTQLMSNRVPKTFDDILLTDHPLETLTDCLFVDHLIAAMNEDSQQDWKDIMNVITSDSHIQSNSQSSSGSDSYTNQDAIKINNLVQELELDTIIQTQSQPNLSELLNDNDNNLMVEEIPDDMANPVLYNAQAQANPPMSISTVSHTLPNPHTVPSPQPVSQDSFAPQASPVSSVSHQFGEISIRSPISQPAVHSPEPLAGSSNWQLNPSPAHYQAQLQTRTRSRSDCLFEQDPVTIEVDAAMATSVRPCRPIVPYQRSNTDPMPSTSSQVLPHFPDAFSYGMPPIASSSQSSLGAWPLASAATSTNSLSAQPVINESAINPMPIRQNTVRTRTASEPILYQRCNLEHNYPVPYRREGQRRGRPSTRTGHRQQTPRERLERMDQERVELEQSNVQLKFKFAHLMSEINHLKLRLESMGIGYPGDRPYTVWRGHQ